jgi:retron-type reverse transcriptase
MKVELVHKFEDIISMENLLAAWQEFIAGKRSKPDVQQWGRHLYDNILQLHNDLVHQIYKHGGYHNFNISDPKSRKISKASVRDRLLHHAVYRILYPFFDELFIFDSYSCRNKKGTHKAIKRLRSMFLEVGDYNRKTCWVLKLDIRQFFASIDHVVLKEILGKYVPDQKILWLLGNIIDSFNTRNKFPDREICSYGLPLGNLTSQLFVNIYMNEFDWFVKNELKINHYIRYADDFVFLSENKPELLKVLNLIKSYLKKELKLSLHPDKIILKTFVSGVDFLGWINFSEHRVLRTATKRRMLNKLNEKNLQSYLGLLTHGNAFKLHQELLNESWLIGNNAV